MILLPAQAVHTQRTATSVNSDKSLVSPQRLARLLKHMMTVCGLEQLEPRPSGFCCAVRGQSFLLTSGYSTTFRVTRAGPLLSTLSHYSRLFRSIAILIAHSASILCPSRRPRPCLLPTSRRGGPITAPTQFVQAKAFGPCAPFSPAKWPGKRQLSCPT